MERVSRGMAHIEYAVRPLRRSRDAITEEATQAAMSPSPRTWWQRILYRTCPARTVEKEELACSATCGDAAYCAIVGTLSMLRTLVNMSNQCVTLNTQERFFSKAMDSSSESEPSSSDRSSLSELPITAL